MERAGSTVSVRFSALASWLARIKSRRMQVGSQPRRLSALLVVALDHSQATAHLVALLALHAFSPTLESQLRAGDDTPLLLAWSDGTLLPPRLRLSGGAPGGPRHRFHWAGWAKLYGDDLLLVRLDVAAPSVR